MKHTLLFLSLTVFCPIFSFGQQADFLSRLGSDNYFYADTVHGADFTYEGFPASIITKTIAGQEIDFNQNGIPEIVVLVVGNQQQNISQTRVLIFEAEGNNKIVKKQDYLIPFGRNRGFFSNGAEYMNRGLVVGDLTNDGILNIGVASGGLPSNAANIVSIDIWINILSVSSNFTIGQIAQRRMFGGGNPLVNSERANCVDLHAVTSQLGSSNPDLIWGHLFNRNSGYSIFSFEYDGNNFVLLDSIGFTFGIHAFTVADVNGNGRKEVVAAVQQGRLSVINYDSTGFQQIFGGGETFHPDSYTHFLHPYDINNDGKEEVVFTNHTQKLIGILSHTSGNNFTVNNIYVDESPSVVMFADMDQDGFVEIIYNQDTKLVFREHNGGSSYAATNWSQEFTLIDNLDPLDIDELYGSAKSLALLFADNDKNPELIVGRGNHSSQFGPGGDELMVYELDRFFGGTGVGGYGVAPNSIEGTFDRIRIDGNLATTDNTEVRNLAIVNAGGNLTVNHNFTLSATNERLFAQMLNFGGSVSGNIAMQKKLRSFTPGSAAEVAWPVKLNLQNISLAQNGFAVNTGANGNIKKWIAAPSQGDEADGWVPGQAIDSANIPYRLEFAMNTTQNWTVRGNPQNGSKIYPLYNSYMPTLPQTDENRGWNFIPNPYPSHIKLDEILADPNFPQSKFVYVWDTKARQYAALGRTVSSNFFPHGERNNIGNIPPMQGFWLKAGINQNFEIKNEMRTAQPNETSFYKTQAGAQDIVRLSVKAVSNNALDQLVVHFTGQSTYGFDAEYDAYKRFSPSPNVPSLWGLVDGTQSCIVGMPGYSRSLFVGFKPMTQSSQYRLELNTSDLLPSTEVWAKDLSNNVYHNLRNSAYQFAHNPNHNGPRFELFFVKTNISVDEFELGENDLVAYPSQEALWMNFTGQQVPVEVVLYDLSGRMLQKTKTTLQEGRQKIFDTAPRGVFIVETHFLENGKMHTQKVMH